MKIASLYKFDRSDLAKKSYMAVIIPALLELHAAKYKKQMADIGLNYKDYFDTIKLTRGCINDDFIYDKVSIIIETMYIKKVI